MNTYDEALEWIHSTARFGSKSGLHRISMLLELLGNPQDRPRYFHIAGTNGKGSVTAMIASSLRAAGYRTGMYISPYLENFRERITINGRWIPEEHLVDLVSVVRPKVDEMVREGEEHPTEFEIITAMAFHYFAREGCDFVSLETGLGGRFDATNVIVPEVSVITTISFDHTERLGNTLSEIAFEKAGIIKKGVPVITGVSQDEPLAVIRKVAEKFDAPVYQVKEGTYSNDGSRPLPVRWTLKRTERGHAIDVVGPGFGCEDVAISLPGRFQEQNAGVACAAILAAEGIPVGCEALRAGLANTVWPGRFEFLSKEPAVILDVAHNPEGIEALAQAIANVPKNNLVCVYGMLSDKPYAQSAASIGPACQTMILTKPDSPRALDPHILAEEAARHTKKVCVEPDLRRAFDLALEVAGPGDVILCCGSIYLVGPLRTYIRGRLGITGTRGE